MRLRHRHAAAHRRGIGAFGEQPLALGFDAGLLEQDRERHAGPVAARDEAVNAAGRLLRRFGVVVAGAVARALEELDARHERIARERVHAEDQRPLDETVDQHLMLIGIDIGYAVVMALEVQRARRDDAFEASSGVREPPVPVVPGCRADGSLHAGLVRRALAVRAQRHARRLHPRRHLRRRCTRRQ